MGQCVHLLALGSLDSNFSVWCLDSLIPIVIIQDIFSQAVTDLCWSGDGSILVAVSADGTLAAVHFDFSLFSPYYEGVMSEKVFLSKIASVFGGIVSDTVRLHWSSLFRGSCFFFFYSRLEKEMILPGFDFLSLVLSKWSFAELIMIYFYMDLCICPSIDLFLPADFDDFSHRIGRKVSIYSCSNTRYRFVIFFIGECVFWSHGILLFPKLYILSESKCRCRC